MDGAGHDGREPPRMAHSANTATSFGTAYFGVRDLDHAWRDLIAMRRAGYEWVVLPMTQDDAVWERATFRELVVAAESAGLEPVVSPWGGDVFGGEGVPGPLSPGEWIDRAFDTGAAILHVDEPKLPPRAARSLLRGWPGRVWLTIEPERWPVLSRLGTAGLEVVGTDAYGGTIDDRIAATRTFAAAVGRLDLAWVRAFRIAAGGEDDVTASVVAMANLAPRVGIWAWKGATGRGELRSERPGHVEKAVQRGIAAVRAAEGVPERTVA